MPSCSHCKYYTDKSCNLERHMRVHQQSEDDGKNKRHKCMLCDVSMSRLQDLLNHFTTNHDIVISKKNFIFQDQAAFENWKSQVEKATSSRYVQHSGKQLKSRIYYCHRDGYFSSRGTGQRTLKVLGSNKINGCCPARITARLDCDSGSVSVEFIETHVGHTNDLGRLHLTKNERNEVADKIAAGVPFKDILEGVRNSVKNDDLDFNHLLTRKDLWNIKQEFNLNEAVRHNNNSISGDSWVTENEENEWSQVVRFYKKQGHLMASNPELKSEDFVLIIANESQLEMLEQFGHDCVCIDGTHDQYDFELTAIMVLDELRQGFPCAFMLSNRMDSAIMKIFFTVVKAELGSPITPKVFMSDMAESCQNAWLEVMPPPEHALLCTWHVDRDWRKNLSKVKNDVKKVQVYRTLRTLLEETDENAFQRLLAAALHSFESDPDKRDFCKYFKSEYGTNTRSWAYCYRAHVGLNTNMHLETTTNQAIKHCFEGKTVKRLDECVSVLMRVIRDKLFNRLIALHRGKLPKKVSDIRRRHKASLEMKNVQLMKTDRGWTISSSSSDKVYEIVLWNAECSCNLRCDDCNICLHNYKCDCLDSSVKWVICRHIHFMVLNSDSGTSTELDETNTLSNPSECSSHIDDDANDELQEVIIEELSQTHDDFTVLEIEKNRLNETWRTVIESVQNIDEIEILKKAILPVMPTIHAARTRNGVVVPKSNVNTQQKMSTQSNFFSTEKEQKKGERLLRKPSNKEKIVHASALLQQEPIPHQQMIPELYCENHAIVGSSTEQPTKQQTKAMIQQGQIFLTQTISEPYSESCIVGWPAPKKIRTTASKFSENWMVDEPNSKTIKPDLLSSDPSFF